MITNDDDYGICCHPCWTNLEQLELGVDDMIGNHLHKIIRLPFLQRPAWSLIYRITRNNMHLVLITPREVATCLTLEFVGVIQEILRVDGDKWKLIG